MELNNQLQERSGNQCELCTMPGDLAPYLVSPMQGDKAGDYAYLCATCSGQIDGAEKPDANHWRCLNESIWSGVPAVQVLSYRMLQRLKEEGWTLDLLEMMYMDEETREWAEQPEQDEFRENQLVHLDSNGNKLEAGDTVVLIQDLNVRGANFTAKRGTAVRNISLDHENANHIEGKVNGQQIVILTKYVKKT